MSDDLREFDIDYLLRVSGKSLEEVHQDAILFEQFVKQEAHEYGVAHLKAVLIRVQREFGIELVTHKHLKTDDSERQRESIMKQLRKFVVTSRIESDDYIIDTDKPSYDEDLALLLQHHAAHLCDSDLRELLHEKQRDVDVELKGYNECRGDVIKKMAHYLCADELHTLLPLDRDIFDIYKKVPHSDLIFYLSNNLQKERFDALPDLFELERGVIINLIFDTFAESEIQAFKSFAKERVEEQDALDREYDELLSDIFAEDEQSSPELDTSKKSVVRSSTKVGNHSMAQTYRFKYVLDDISINHLPKNTKENVTTQIRKVFGNLKAHELTSLQVLEAARENVVLKYPHANLIIDSILNKVRRGFRFGKREIKLKPVLLVGDPGSGKSSLARDLMKALNVDVTTVNAGGMFDNHILGVSSGYSSAMPSIVTTAVACASSVNPAIIIDEIDKTAKDSRNGDIVAGLLSLLEPAEAISWYEKFLNLNVDASHINWLLTANDIDHVPLPLISRCVVYRMENPDVQHVGLLVKSIIDDYASEVGVDSRFFSLSAGDIDYLRETMHRHRSVRVLRELVRMLLDEQDSEIYHA